MQLHLKVNQMIDKMSNNDRWSSDPVCFHLHHVITMIATSTYSPLQGRSKLFQGGVAEVYIVSRGAWGNAP